MRANNSYAVLVDAAREALEMGRSSVGPAPFEDAQARLDSGSSPDHIWCARLLLIAGIKAEERTGDPVYHTALGTLDALLRHPDARMDVGLDSDFAEAKDRHALHLARIRDEVARHEWATRARFDLRPFHFERHSLRPGRRVRGDAKTARFEYGFDAHDALRLVRTDRYEAFIDHTEEGIRHLQYDRRGKLVHVQRYSLLEGRVVSRRFLAKQGVGQERYTYEGAHLVRIDGENYSGGQGWKMEQLEADYDADGSLQLLELVYECIARRSTLWRSEESNVKA